MAQAPMQQIVTVDSAAVADSRLAPGDATDIKLIVTRSCSNAFQVLPAGSLDVDIGASLGIVVVTGPSSIALDEQVCAQETTRNYMLSFNATARSDLGEDFTSADETVHFNVYTHASNPTAAPSDRVQALVLLTVKAPEPLAVAGGGDEARASPGVGALLGVGLLGLVAMVRRRGA